MIISDCFFRKQSVNVRDSGFHAVSSVPSREDPLPRARKEERGRPRRERMDEPNDRAIVLEEALSRRRLEIDAKCEFPSSSPSSRSDVESEREERPSGRHFLREKMTKRAQKFSSRSSEFRFDISRIRVSFGSATRARARARARTHTHTHTHTHT